MRVKTLFVGAAVAATLLGAAAVQAATPQQLFVGDFEGQPDSTVRLKTGATNDYRVRVFGAHNFTIDCGADDGIIKRASLKGQIPIGNRGGFHARDDNGQTVINLRGTIDKRRATGTFHFSGEVEAQDGTTQNCDSGRMHWSARMTGEPDIG